MRTVQELFSLKGKAAIVTGGSRGLGLQMAQALVEAAIARLGHVDILINNAGATWGAPAEDYPLEAWAKVMNLNVRSVFLVSQAVGKLSMIPRRYGRIVNIASIAGLAGNPPAAMQTLAYNTSKGAVVNFTRTLAGEWGRYGITVNAIAPGYVESEMNSDFFKTEAGRKVIQAMPRRRLGQPYDLDGTLLLLTSNASDYLTGTVITVDDGQTLL